MKTIRKILVTIKSGFVNAWTHKSNGFASILSIAAVSIIMGIVIIVSLSANVIVQDVQSRVDEIEIYISDDIDEKRIDDLEKEIGKIDGVENIQYKDKEDALEIMKEAWGEDAYLLEGLEKDNPLERSFVVNVRDIENSDGIVKEVKSLAGVSTVTYYQDTINKLINLSQYIKYGGLFVSAVLLIISIIVISNTVKLTVESRKDEIQIMKYLGSSDAMITTPFIIEGIIFGLIGSLLAYMVIYCGYGYAYGRFNEKLYQVISTYMINPDILKINLLIIFLMLGIVIGTIGSLFSTKKHLKV